MLLDLGGGSTPIRKIRALLFLSPLFLVLAAPARAQTSGSTQWIATFQDAGPLSGEAQPVAVATDSVGNVYVTGWASVSENFCAAPTSCTQALTIKYDPTGKVLWKDWLSTVNPPNQGGAVAQGLDIALDSTGNAYVLFTYTHPQVGNSSQIVSEVVTAKYNSAGGRDWIDFLDSSHAPGTIQRMPVQFAVSPLGNVYVTYTVGVPDSTNGVAVVTKYDTAGHTIWSQTVNDASPTTSTAIGMDAAENIYVEIGLLVPPYADGEIVKYDINGNRLATFGRGQIGLATGFHVDPDGACYYSGRGANNGTPLPDLAVAKFNPDQSLAYLVDVTKLENGLGANNGPGSGPDGSISTITSDSAGDAFVLQEIDNTGSAFEGSDISVLKLDPSGNEVFVTRYNSQSDESGRDFPAALAVSPSGEVYATGSNVLSVQANTLEFVTIKYDSTGVQQWVEQYTTTTQYAAPKAMVLAGTNLIVTGTASASGSPASEWATIDYVP